MPTPPPATADQRAALRADIRKALDTLEAAALDDKSVTFTPKQASKLALMLRNIQDMAAKNLGYE